MLSNYPDDFDHSLLDGDEDFEKLPCGCYEEGCECPKCEYCGEIIDVDDECPNECEDDDE